MNKAKEKKERPAPASGINTFEAVELNQVPWRDMLYAWECVDWVLIQQLMGDDQAVCIKDIEPDEEEHWFTAAYKQLGKQNVEVFYNSINSLTGNLWIVPKESVPGNGVDVLGPRISENALII